MRNMTANQCHLELKTILSESIECAQNLYQVLTKERSALETRDTDALDSATTEKQQHLNKLEQLDNERGALSNACGYGNHISGMPDLIAWCDENQVIAENWLGFTDIARDCGQMNTTNGSIIQLRRQQIKQSLTLLRSGSDRRETYGPDGEETSTLGARSLAEI